MARIEPHDIMSLSKAPHHKASSSLNTLSRFAAALYLVEDSPQPPVNTQHACRPHLKSYQDRFSIRAYRCLDSRPSNTFRGKSENKLRNKEHLGVTCSAQLRPYRGLMTLQHMSNIYQIPQNQDVCLQQKARYPIRSTCISRSSKQ